METGNQDTKLQAVRDWVEHEMEFAQKQRMKNVKAGDENFAAYWKGRRDSLVFLLDEVLDT